MKDYHLSELRQITVTSSWIDSWHTETYIVPETDVDNFLESSIRKDGKRKITAIHVSELVASSQGDVTVIQPHRTQRVV